MRLSTLAGPLGARDSGGDLSTDVHALTRDSREVVPGALFVAIQGEHFDGHAAVSGLPRGAAAVVSRRPEGAESVPWLLVDDTRVALAVAAAELHGRPAHAIDVVGVTGTNGKTTVTTLIAQALEATGHVVGRIGTTGVRLAGQDRVATLTTPEAPQLQAWFAELRDAGGTLCAIEVSSIGVVQHRTDAIPFALGVFTNLGRDHLDFHGTVQAYAAAKAQLFGPMLRPPGGAPRALLWRDDGSWEAVGAPADRWTYGFDPRADVCITRWSPGGDGMALTLTSPEGEVEVRSPLIGRHNALNLAAAWASGVLRGVDPHTMADGLALATGPRGRLEPVPNARGLLVLVDYAHTPDALEAAIASVRAVTQGQVWVVFGCGGDRDAGKRPQMGRVALSADRVVVTSDNPRSEDPEAIVADILAGMPEGHGATVQLDRAQAIRWALHQARPGDAVLLAGKGHETTQEVAGHKRPFDDRAVARAAMEAA